MNNSNKRSQNNIELTVLKYIDINKQCKLSEDTFKMILEIVHMYYDTNIDETDTEADLINVSDSWNLIDLIVTLTTYSIVGTDDKENDELNEIIHNLIVYYIYNTEFGKYIGTFCVESKNINNKFVYNFTTGSELYYIIQRIIALYKFDTLTIFETLDIIHKKLPYKNKIYIRFDNDIKTIADLDNDLTFKYVFLHDKFTSDMQKQWKKQWKQLCKDLNVSKKFPSFNKQCIDVSHEDASGYIDKCIDFADFLYSK